MSRDSALDAYWNFFRSFNTRDAYEFSAALHYPHVRFSWRSDPVILADLEAHALRMSWKPFIAMGWDHTNGLEPEVVHESGDKWHIKGGWTRVDKDDNPILSNRVTYIVTRLEGSWGIQCRYGTDPNNVRPSDDIENQSALDIAREWYVALHAQDEELAKSLCAKAYYEINAGSVAKQSMGTDLELDSLSNMEIKTIQGGSNSATIALNGMASSVLIYLTKTEQWTIKAVSWV